MADTAKTMVFMMPPKIEPYGPGGGAHLTNKRWTCATLPRTDQVRGDTHDILDVVQPSNP